MDPKDYTGKEWTDLLREMNGRQIKNSLKGGFRRVGKKVREMALRHLISDGPAVAGDMSDWKKGLRLRIYPKGNGFMLTVKPRKGKSEQGMHKNRRYGKTITRGARRGTVNTRKLPVIMWAEDGSRERHVGARVGGSSFFSLSRWTGRKVRNYQRSGHSTGRMPSYRFLEKSEAEGYRIVESDLGKDVEEAVMKAAKKAGML